MADLFLKMFNMSVSAMWIVFAIILLRVFLKKSPKWVNAALWGLVGLRLILPVSFKSILSLIPSINTIPTEIVDTSTPYIESGFTAINQAVNPIISKFLAPDMMELISPIEFLLSAATLIWIIGVGLMFLYTFASYLNIYLKVREGVRDKDNIILCDRVDTPFVMGIIRPKIYIPSNLGESDKEYIIAHEKSHIKRRDYLWKPLAFLLLSFYWFNPVFWVAYVLLCRDIEYACDEKVIKECGEEKKAYYSETLLNCSIPRKAISACPVAFGEVGIKGRIKNILSYKKPSVLIVAVSLVLSTALAVCFLTDPLDNGGGAEFVTKKAGAVNLKDEIVTSAVTETKDGGAVSDTKGGKETVSVVTSAVTLNNNVETPDKIFNNYDYMGNLNFETFKRIKDDYRGNQEIKLDEIILSYCTTLKDGSVAVYMSQTGVYNLDVMVEDYIAGEYLYSYSSGMGMLIYKDNQFNSIKYAYENGIISKEVLDELFKKFPKLNSINKYLTTEDYLGNLDIEIAKEIKEAYFAELYHFGKAEYTDIKDCKDIIIENCGTLSDGTVLIKFNLKKPIANPISMVDEIGKYKYGYKLGYDVRIIVQGKNYNTVKYAYQKNQISSAVVDEFFSKLTEINR